MMNIIFSDNSDVNQASLVIEGQFPMLAIPLPGEIVAFKDKFNFEREYFVRNILYNNDHTLIVVEGL